MLLYLSCMYKASPELVLLLIESCAAAAVERDYEGRTPLHVACTDSAMVEVIFLILDKYPGVVMEEDNY
eukprot:12478854-Ditylum_brightwellii.AAC.1